MTHYCGGCDADDTHDRDEWCCGGEGRCDAVQSEPDCEVGRHGRHDWTSEGTGGCDSNPGCWSLGGTAYQFDARCTVCGMGRTEIQRGSQRNPGECDSVSYSRREYEPDEA